MIVLSFDMMLAMDQLKTIGAKDRGWLVCISTPNDPEYGIQSCSMEGTTSPTLLLFVNILMYLCFNMTESIQNVGCTRSPPS